MSGSTTTPPRRRIVENVIPLDAVDGAPEQPYDISNVEDVLTRNVPPRPPDLIDLIYPADARLIDIVGHEGDGKTTGALLIFMPAAVGRKACGRFAVARPIRTVMIEDDTPDPVMRRREAAIVSAMRLTPAEQSLFRSHWLPIRDPGFVFREPARLTETLAMLEAEHRPADVVLVDNRTTAWVDHPDDPVAAREVFDQVIKPLAARYGVTFVILSHPPKARTDAKGNRATLTVAGTGVHQRPTDVRISVWLESRDPDIVSLTWEKVRDGRKPPKMFFTAEIDPEDWGWCALHPSDATDIDDAAVDRAMAALVAYITVERTRQACIDHVKATTGYEARTADAALYQLHGEKTAGKKKRGREVVYFPLTNPQEDLSIA